MPYAERVTASLNTYRALPKVELHRHLEGSLRLDTMLDIARQHGITPLQYLMMLHIKGYPGREWATVGELAERLQTQQHGVVALISRCEKLKLVERRRSPEDRRRIEVHLIEDGQRMVERIARLHRTQLAALQGRFVVPDIESFEES